MIDLEKKGEGIWHTAKLMKFRQDVEAKQQELEDKEKTKYSVDEVIEEWKMMKSAFGDQRVENQP